MTSKTLRPGAELWRSATPFALDHESPLDPLELAFELVGPPDAPVVLALGGISASAHVASHPTDPGPGWWEAFVGPERAVDTRRFRVLGIDWIGGAGASSRVWDPVARPFPVISSADQARAIVQLLDTLGIERLHAVLGSSYGGMVGLVLAALAPERVRRLVSISGGAGPEPMATAWRSLGRRVLRLGANAGGDAEREALSLVRGLGMTTYRSADEFRERFSAPPVQRGSRFQHPVEEYLEARGADFVGRFSLHALHCLSESIDLHRIDPAEVRVPTTVVAVDRDVLVPPVQLRALADALPALAEYQVLSSIYGHDAFLKETLQLRPVLARALEADR